MTMYRLIKAVGEGLVVIKRHEFRNEDESLWDRTKVRKPHTCAVTGAPIEVGKMAYRPVGNSMYRYERIRADVVDSTEVGNLISTEIRPTP